VLSQLSVDQLVSDTALKVSYCTLCAAVYRACSDVGVLILTSCVRACVRVQARIDAFVAQKRRDGREKRVRASCVSDRAACLRDRERS
jgi:hypothetical protein